jgi:UDP-N-acetylglucosamine--N-acetylmuramyl-(pentapeptide) pyrophosphoryl-undecaprenol N-acetylglucosamine transferase
MTSLRVIFAGGGTGGHLFPAIAIADGLKDRLGNSSADSFLFVGTRRGIEYRIREKLGYPLELINIKGVVRSLSFQNLLFPFLLIGAVIKSVLIISRFKPDIVVGTGGYVMGPVIMAASIMKIPRVIQEQNSYPGLATRKLAGLADIVFLGFGEAAKYLGRRCRAIESGNPIKRNFGEISREEGCRHFNLDPAKNIILVLGGSQGAMNINQNITRHLDRLPSDYELIWQTGERAYKDVAASAGGRVKSRALFPFTDNIEMAYAAADIVIARAGALTLAEIEASAKPAILIPYPYATGNHQTINAGIFSKSGSALVIEDARLGELNLLREAVELFRSGRLAEMTAKAGTNLQQNKKRAVDIICDEIQELVTTKKE